MSGLDIVSYLTRDRQSKEGFILGLFLGCPLHCEGSRDCGVKAALSCSKTASVMKELSDKTEEELDQIIAEHIKCQQL